MQQLITIVLMLIIGTLLGIFFTLTIIILNGGLIINKREKEEYKMLKLKYQEYKKRVQ